MQQVDGRNLCEYCFAEMNETDMFCPVCESGQGQFTPEPGVMAPGEILAGKYLIGKMLGRGGFGITYLGYDVPGKKKVAIKEYLPDGLAVRQPGQNTLTVYTGDKETLFKRGADKFFEEAKMVSRFNGNPNIVSVYEFFYENNTAYFVMEYLDGVDLKKYVVQHGGRISVDDTVNLLSPVIDALIVVHSAGVLHRDISPDNIFITKEGESKLLDFGAARQVIGEQSKSLSVVLKQGFAPVEQYQTRGNFGPWSDIYAFCATIYFAVTGKVPVPAMDRMDTDRLMPPSAMGIPVSPGLERVIMRGLSYRAVDRQQSMLEFKAEFTQAVPREEKAPEPEDIYVNPYSYQKEFPGNLPESGGYVQNTGYGPTTGLGADTGYGVTGYGHNTEMEKLYLFIDKNVPYYHGQFKKIRMGRFPRFHIPAFLAPQYWFIYRKMYIPGAIVYAFQLLSTLIAAAVISHWVNASDMYFAFGVTSVICSLLVIVLSGLFANKLYYSYGMKTIQENAAAYDQDNIILRKKGGVQKTGFMAGMIVLMGIVSMLVSFVSYRMLGSAYNNYMASRADSRSSYESPSRTDTGDTKTENAGEQPVEVVRNQYYSDDDIETEALGKLFEKVFPGGEWRSEQENNQTYVEYIGEGYNQNRKTEYEFLFTVAGGEITLQKIQIGGEEVEANNWADVFAMVDVYYKAMDKGQAGVMSLMFIKEEFVTTLSEAEYLLKGADIGYDRNKNPSGERVDLTLKDGTVLAFFKVRFSKNNVPEDYILIMKEGEVDTAAFELYYYGTEPDPSYYFFGMIGTEYVDESQLRNMNQTDLYIMRNEMFADHGRKFEDPFIKGLFSYTSWYNPLYEPSEFPDNFNSIEKSNIDTIVKIEKELGYWDKWL